jgi:hypothetical protein
MEIVSRLQSSISCRCKRWKEIRLQRIALVLAVLLLEVTRLALSRKNVYAPSAPRIWSQPALLCVAVDSMENVIITTPNASHSGFNNASEISSLRLALNVVETCRCKHAACMSSSKRIRASWDERMQRFCEQSMMQHCLMVIAMVGPDLKKKLSSLGLQLVRVSLSVLVSLLLLSVP